MDGSNCSKTAVTRTRHEPKEAVPTAMSGACADNRAAGDGPDDGNGGTTTAVPYGSCEDWTVASDRRTAELNSERLRKLCVESISSNRRTAGELRDAKRENVRSFMTVCELVDDLCEFETKTAELENRHHASRTAERERAAEADDVNAENRRLNAAVSDSKRHAETAVRSAAEAIDEAKSSVLTTREQYDSAVRRAKRLDERRAVRRAALSAAVVRLQSVLSSPVADLRPDVLQTVARRLRQQTVRCETDDGTDRCGDTTKLADE